MAHARETLNYKVKRDCEKLNEWLWDVVVRISERCHHERASITDPRVGKEFTL